MEMSVRRFYDTRKHLCYVVGGGLGCSRETMESSIIPAIRTDFPEMPDVLEGAFFVILLHDHGVKKEETVIGAGLGFMLPSECVAPISYEPMPEDYETRGEPEEETGSEPKIRAYLVPPGDRLFVMSSLKGCSFKTLLKIFAVHDGLANSGMCGRADYRKAFIIFFSREPDRRQVGLRASGGKFDSELVPEVRELPRCVP